MFRQIVVGYLGSFVWGVKIAVALTVISVVGGLVFYANQLSERIEALEIQITNCEQAKQNLRANQRDCQRNIIALKRYYESKQVYTPDEAPPRQMLE